METPLPEHGSPLPSLRTHSIIRFGAEASGVFFAMVGGAITARWLGPGGKGTLAALLYLVSLSVEVASFGLGDAATILMGQKKASIQEATSATSFTLVGTSVVAMGLLALVASLQFDLSSDIVKAAILAAVITVPFETYSNVLGIILNARERIPATSLVFVTNRALTVGGVIVFVIVLDWSVLGGVLAPALASAVAMLAMIRLLRRMDVRIHPRASREYLSHAFRLGIMVQGAYLVIALSQRLDQLLVYSIAGRSQAGHYSVALTLGQLVIYAPTAIAFAAYPRAAHIDEGEVASFTAIWSRLGTASALVGLAILLPLIPVATPLVFGDDFRPAVAPAMVLVFSGVLSSVQWILARAAAARGNTGLLFRSFGVSLLSMVGLDLVLIPAWGTTGAAAGSLLSHAAGLLICLREYHKASFRISDLLPTPADFIALTRLPRLFSKDAAP